METSSPDPYASLRQHMNGPLYSSGEDINSGAPSASSPETVNVDLTVSGRSSARDAVSSPASAHPSIAQEKKESTNEKVVLTIPTPTSAHCSPPPAVQSPKVVEVTTVDTECSDDARESAFVGQRESSVAPPVLSLAIDSRFAARNSENAASPADPAAPAVDALEDSDQPYLVENNGDAPSPSHGLIHSAGPHASSAPSDVMAGTTAQEARSLDATTPAAPASNVKRDKTPMQRRKAAHTPVRRPLYSAATSAKQTPKRTTRITAAQIAHLLSDGGAASQTGTPEKGKLLSSATGLAPLDSLDLPLGLFLLYGAAEDACATVEDVAAPSPAAAGARASSSAYSLLYLLERLSDQRRKDRRRAALQHASATEEARCAQLFEAAKKRHAAQAAVQAARAHEVEEEELGLCTFHPEVSPAAQGVTGKGTKDFMAKCVEWREEAARRLQQKYERQAELEAEQAAALAAQNGIAEPGSAVTVRSRRLLEDPSVQERLKCRPDLWEAKKPISDALHRDVVAGSAGSASEAVGVPVGMKLIRDQEAVLRGLRHPDRAGQDSTTVLDTSSASQTRRSGQTVRQFLSRLEEDNERRETTASRLQSRYHNPEMELFESNTGQPFFAPNAMPTVWKDGRRVGYADLTKDEQRDFRAELRKAGLDFVLARFQRQQKDGSREHGETSNAEGSEGGHDASAMLQGATLTAAQQERFMASLQNALTRREQNLQRIREQATAEETFHPHLTPRSIRLARNKIGSKPIYERSTVARDAAAVPPKTAHSASSADADTSTASAHRDRPLPQAAEVFLARNDQWTQGRQRRLEHLAAMEEEKRFGDCTFTPNRTFYESEHSQLRSVPAGGNGSALSPAPLEDSRAGSSEQGRQRAAHSRHHDELATAADVRLLNELELLRSGAAFRNEEFVQAVCERSGVADARQAMANLSLQSAPRLTGGRRAAAAAGGGGGGGSVQRGEVSGSASSPSQRVSPIPTRSSRPSVSPYAMPSRFGPHAETSASLSTVEGQRSVPMMRTESGATQTPTRRESQGGHALALALPSSATSRTNNARGAVAELPPVEDPWAALDAQTDAILKRHGY